MYIAVIGELGKVRKTIVLKCSECNKLFCNRYVTKFLNAKLHFCSKQCHANALCVDHILNLKIRETCLKKFGYVSASSSTEMKEKVKKTSIKRYGVENVFQAQEFISKIEQTCLERYGVKHYTMTQEFKDRCKKENLEKLGVEYPMQSLDVRKKAEIATFAHYGVKNPSQANEIKEKKKQTCLLHYGVEYYTQSEHSKNNPNYKLGAAKAHETRKKNKTYVTSKLENLFYDFLCEQFNASNVIRQIRINQRWEIDFYINSLSVYVQFDGIYWHGLDRPIEEIREHKQLRDVTISKKYDTDREQEKWFLENDLSLVRIIESSFKDNTQHQAIIELIKSAAK
jgi:hypothetical protein